MGDANPICTLGDYSKPSNEGYRNTIELPEGNNVVPLRSDTIRLVQNGCSFHELQFEDPNKHFKDFLKLVDSLDLNDLEDSTVTYTEVSSPFEDLSDIGSSGVDGLPMMLEDPYAYVEAALQAPPSPDYVPGPEHPPLPVYVPYVPEPAYLEFMPPEDDVLPAEEQLLLCANITYWDSLVILLNTWDEMVDAMQEVPATDVAELSQRMTDFVTTVRQDTDEIYRRLYDEEDDRSLMSGQLNLLRRDRCAHARTAILMESEDRLSSEAWVQSMDASDTARFETRMAALQSQQTPARDLAHPDVPEEEGRKMAPKRTTRSTPITTTTPTTSVTDEQLKKFNAQELMTYVGKSIERFLNNFSNQPNKTNMNDLDSDDESVDIPLVSPFPHSDNDSDDGVVLNELIEYENAGTLR
ncbi:hypothetical protein Tco_0412119 [Tanacetum coccineum]